VEQDVVVVTAICVLVIGLSIALFFRSIWAILSCGSRGPGHRAGFCRRENRRGYLNSSTAFLGSIILGNGINHGIVFLARYQNCREQRPRPSMLACTRP